MVGGEEFTRPVIGALFTMATTAVLVCLLGIRGLASPPPLPETASLVRALATLAFLAAGALRLGRWRITGEARCGLRGVALVLMGGVALPCLVLVRTLSASGEGVAAFGCLRALSVAAALYVLGVALSDDTPPVTDLRQRAVSLAAVAVAGTGLLLAGGDRLRIGTPSHWMLLQGLASALALAWLALAVRAVIQGARADWARPTAPLLALMGVAELCRLPERPLTTLLAATLTAGVGLVVAATALVDLLVAAQTERTAAEALARELTDARTAVSTRDAWRADLAHDARGTLAGIRAAISTLDRHADELDPATADRLRVATMAELTHLEHMLEPRETEGKLFDVADVVRTVTDVRRVAGLRVDVTLESAQGRGAPGDLATVLQNLLVNAQQHAPDAHVRVDVRPDGACARILVEDDGPGFRSDTARYAFGRGSRGPGSDGSGLGLSIARTLARRHGGELNLLPSARGTRLVITWPLAAEPTVPHRMEAAAS